MKNLITILFLMFSLASFSQTKYPIKTIFKGDSVIILTIQQSENINAMIEKNVKAAKEANKRNIEYMSIIDSLEYELMRTRNRVDSLELTVKNQVPHVDSTVYDSLWRWALGPTLIYTQYPDDSNIYLFDLSHYYMTTDDFGIMMAKMNDRDYKKYQDFINTYGLDEKAIWKFKNEMNIEYLSKSKMEEKKVWKYKRK